MWLQFQDKTGHEVPRATFRTRGSIIWPMALVYDNNILFYLFAFEIFEVVQTSFRWRCTRV